MPLMTAGSQKVECPLFLLLHMVYLSLPIVMSIVLSYTSSPVSLHLQVRVMAVEVLCSKQVKNLLSPRLPLASECSFLWVRRDAIFPSVFHLGYRFFIFLLDL